MSSENEERTYIGEGKRKGRGEKERGRERVKVNSKEVMTTKRIIKKIVLNMFMMLCYTV